MSTLAENFHCISIFGQEMGEHTCVATFGKVSPNTHTYISGKILSMLTVAMVQEFAAPPEPGPLVPIFMVIGALGVALLIGSTFIKKKSLHSALGTTAMCMLFATAAVLITSYMSSSVDTSAAVSANVEKAYEDVEVEKLARPYRATEFNGTVIVGDEKIAVTVQQDPHTFEPTIFAEDPKDQDKFKKKDS